ncbi:hypothetical protein AVEN_218660-1 [Araneus ventricosus]|uniref:Uncharacterized protein n=1 Tax=Araneus ventricosus TaxID=182803 RepID=A0A4Y2B6G8_ARAVE|nr:hypothetical protein AVEN_218660-1 [Araneus ventricosus]
MSSLRLSLLAAYMTAHLISEKLYKSLKGNPPEGGKNKMGLARKLTRSYHHLPEHVSHYASRTASEQRKRAPPFVIMSHSTNTKREQSKM